MNSDGNAPGDHRILPGIADTRQQPAPPLVGSAVNHVETPGQVPSTRPSQRTRVIWTSIAVVGVVAVLAGGFFGYRVAAKRLAGAAKIDRAQTLIEEADKTVVAIDEVVVAEVGPASAKRAAELTPSVESARAGLQQAVKLLNEARPTATADEQRRAGLLGESAAGRLAMLEQAPTILRATVKAAAAKDLGERGWQRGAEADGLSDQAVEQFNKLNKASAEQSAKFDAQAQAGWLEAKGLLAQAEAAFPEADFEPFLAYCDSKLAEVALSQQATAAYVKGDITAANQLADSFNAEDKRLIEVAKALPPSIGDVVAKAYERTAEAATNSYFSAREQATKADDKLRRF